MIAGRKGGIAQMTLQEFYASIDSSYDAVLGRLMKESFVLKYLKKYLNTTDVQDMLNALAEENYPDAFRFAHNLKGMAANLELQPLRQTAEVLCEALRPGKKPEIDITGMPEAVVAADAMIRERIGKLD